MKQLTVKTSTHNYKIYVGSDLRFRIQSLLEKDYSKILIITDDVVEKLYLDDIKSSLDRKEVHEAIISSGEASKNIEQYYYLQSIALEKNLDRRSLILALGGGVVGDLAGFVAATFMRGIDYIQIPTTILAHDSSVGGKVAINHELGKNMIGAFYPPVAVIYDIDTIQSLPKHEFRSGYAEILKEAYIADEHLLQQLLSMQLVGLQKQDMIEHIFSGIKIKATIVEKDEKESYERKFLNFGHTLAHAIEAELGYGKVTHGEAVAIGMLFALKVSERYFNIELHSEKYKQWMVKNKYPLTLFEIDINDILQKMKLDKKTTENQIQMVLLENIGKPTVVNLDDEPMIQYLNSFKKELNES